MRLLLGIALFILVAGCQDAPRQHSAPAPKTHAFNAGDCVQFKPEIGANRTYEKWEKADTLPKYVYRIAEVGEDAYHILDTAGPTGWFKNENTWTFSVYDTMVRKVPCP